MCRICRHNKLTILACVFLTVLNIVACGQVKEGETVNVEEFAANQQESNMQEAEDTGLGATADELLDSFINGSISAVDATDLTSSFYITDLKMDSEEWDSYSIGEKVDLDNDGENELIINGPYGGIYLDARDNMVYEFAAGDGTALILSYTYYNGAVWIMHSSRSSAGFEFYHMEKFEGADNLVAEMNFGEEFDINNPEAGLKFTLNGTEISYDEYTELCSKIFAAEVNTNFLYYLPEESTSDIRQTSPSEMNKSEQFTAAEKISEIESQTEMTQILEIYEGEYTGNTINDPNYDCLEIQKNEDDTYGIQVKIPFLTRLYECTGYQSENIILFSTSEWGTDKKVEGSISFDDDSATVTFTSGWYQTATTESSYQYHKTSDTPHPENCPEARPDYSSFTGEYCDTYDDPSLKIQLNEDGSYLIQISLFREIGYDACIGSLSEEKMSFTSDQRGGVSGSITLDNDLAVVRFEQIGYFENAKVTTYLFHKTSDNPNIDEQLN